LFFLNCIAVKQEQTTYRDKTSSSFVWEGTNCRFKFWRYIYCS